MFTNDELGRITGVHVAPSDNVVDPIGARVAPNDAVVGPSDVHLAKSGVHVAQSDARAGFPERTGVCIGVHVA